MAARRDDQKGVGVNVDRKIAEACVKKCKREGISMSCLVENIMKLYIEDKVEIYTETSIKVKQ